MTTKRKLQITAAGLMVAGIAGLIPLGYFYHQNQAAAATAPRVQVPQATRPTQPEAVSGKPVSISIPSLELNLPVIDGQYDQNTGKWTLTTDKAQFATPTAEPNNIGGNTLIYGHYRKGVFNTLHTIQPGAQALITTDNGYTFTYTFENSETVDPSNTDIFLYKGAPRLTIQTCSGAFFQNRQFFYFKYTGYQKQP